MVGLWDGMARFKKVETILLHAVTYNPYKYLQFVFAGQDHVQVKSCWPKPTEAHMFSEDKRAQIFVHIPS